MSYWALFPLPVTELKIGMKRVWPMIDASALLKPALMPGLAPRYRLPVESKVICELGYVAICAGEMPLRIWSTIMAVLLLLTPMLTVPRLPGEPVPCGNRLTSRIPSEPAVTVPGTLQFQTSVETDMSWARHASQVCLSRANGRSIRLPGPLLDWGMPKPAKLLMNAAVAGLLAVVPLTPKIFPKKLGTWPFSSPLRRTVTWTALNRFLLAPVLIVPPDWLGFAINPVTMSLPARFGDELQTWL